MSIEILDNVLQDILWIIWQYTKVKDANLNRIRDKLGKTIV